MRIIAPSITLLLLTALPAYAQYPGYDASAVTEPPPPPPPQSADAGASSSADAWTTPPFVDAGSQTNDAGVSEDSGEADASEEPVLEPDEPPESLGPCNSTRFDDATGEGSLILTAAEGVSPEALRDLVEAHGAEVTHEYSFGIAAAFSSSAYASALADPAWSTSVAVAEPDLVLCTTSLPDLRITDLKVTPTNARAGALIAATLMITNFGTDTASNFGVTIYQNLATKPTVSTPKGANTHTTIINTLAGGASVQVHFNLSYGATGTKIFWGLIDSHGSVVESTESNNASDAHTIIVSGAASTARPDLVFSAFAPSTANTFVDKNMTINVTVRNRGSLTAGTFYVSAYKDLGSAPDTSSARDATAKVASLAPGTTRAFTLTISYDQPGVYSAWAMADSFGNADESNEASNVRGPTAITVRTRPELFVTACNPPLILQYPFVHAATDGVPIRLGVTNSGQTAAGTFEVSIFKNRVSVPLVSTAESASAIVSALAPGAEVFRNFAPTYATPNFYNLWCLADSDGQVNEQNEFNDYSGPHQFTIIARQATPTGVRRIRGNLSSALSGNEDGTTDVTVAVIDTGIDSEHPELNVVLSAGVGFASGEDDNGHGTHVAGTIAARDNRYGVVGVAPGARLWAIKVFDFQGQGTLAAALAGIDFVRANAGIVRVANLSFRFPQVIPTLNARVADAVNAGVTMVVAAGNDGVDASFVSPASEPSAITVGALVDIDGAPGGHGGMTVYGRDDTYANFSNYGDVIDVIAPGVNIRSTRFLIGDEADFGHRVDSGTSMAAPHVAGLAALVIAANPSLSPAGVRQAILNAVTQDIPRSHGEARATYPLVNADPL